MKEVLKEMRKCFTEEQHLKVFDEMIIDYIKKFYKKKPPITISHNYGILDFD